MDLHEYEKIRDALKADESRAKNWLERNLNWIIAVGCFLMGAIVAHFV